MNKEIVNLTHSTYRCGFAVSQSLSLSKSYRISSQPTALFGLKWPFLHFFLCLAFLISGQPSWATEPFKVLWPTPNPAFVEGLKLEAYIQATASGKIKSGTFGCVRNGGRRFHEGIDLKPIHRDRKGFSIDPVFATMAGRVVHINKKSGNSSYGRYIVLEHAYTEPKLYTLYAHLKSISSNLSVGKSVDAGTVLGIMGRSSARSRIPKSRAHLHFEVGLRLSDDFQKWYDKQAFGNKNQHGIWNGMNLVGLDALDFFQKFKDDPFLTPKAYLGDLPTAFRLRVSTRRIPDFVRRYPDLLTQPLPDDGSLLGWDIDFTWFGLPKSWTPLNNEEHHGSVHEGDVTLLDYNEGHLKSRGCRKTILIKPQGPQMGKSLQSSLQLLFGWY